MEERINTLLPELIESMVSLGTATEGLEDPLGLAEPEIEVRSKVEVLAELLQRHKKAEDFRKQYEEKALRCFTLYRPEHREAIEGRSNLHIPRVYEYVDTLRARVLKSFVGQRPYVEFIPKIVNAQIPDAVQDAVAKARVASALVDMQLETSQITAKAYNYITSYMVYPAGILGVGWKYEEKMVKRKEISKQFILDPYGQPLLDVLGQPLVQEITEIVEALEVVYDDNEIINIDFFDFWVDPKGQDLDDCRFVFHREWLSREDIEAKARLWSEAHGGQAFTIDWDAVKESVALQDGRTERFSQVGLAPPEDRAIDEGLILYEVLNYWEDERYAMIINRQELAYDGPNPYWRHMRKPFVMQSFEPLPNEIYGISAVELVADLQEETNTHRNQRMDNISFALNRMFTKKRDADIDESQLVSRPNGVVDVDNHDDIKEMAISNVTNNSYTEEQITKMDMENTLGVPSVVRGVDSSRRETATEVVTKSSNASLRFDVKIMLFDTKAFNRLARLMDMNNQQFIDEERLVRLVGMDGTESWRMVVPGEIVGEWDYRPAGPAIDPAANKEIRRQQLLMAYEIATRTQNPYINLYQLTKTLFENLDLTNVEALLVSEAELQQQQMAAMMQQMMQAQAQGAEGGVPGQQGPAVAPGVPHPAQALQQDILSRGGPA